MRTDSVRPDALMLLSLAAVTAAPALGESSIPAWQLPAFEADAGALLAAADSLESDDDPVAILLIEHTITYDDAGRASATNRTVYQIRTDVGVSGWDEVSARWPKWHMERPEIAARVIDPDGEISTFDPSTLTEQSAGRPEWSEIYSDLTDLSGPLPDLRIGSLVEEVTHLREIEPFFSAGSIRRLGVGQMVPVHHARVVIDHPHELSLRLTVTGDATYHKDEERAGDREVVTFTFDRIDPVDEQILFRSNWSISRPGVVVGTGESWKSVAGAYDALVDERLVGFEPPPMVRELMDADVPREEILRRCLNYVREEVRYTGLIFGSGAIEPWKPDAVIQRGYGDCKDQATLLVGMLRAAGIDAYVALLNTGPSPHVPDDVPGLGLFDHAIVYVDEGDIRWIDPTARWLPLGAIPWSDQGRRALVCKKGSNKLTTIPVLSSEYDHLNETRRFTFTDFGYAEVEEYTRASGRSAAQYRDGYVDAIESAAREHLSQYVESVYMADSLLSWSTASADEPDEPFELTIRAAGAAQAFCDESEGYVLIDYSSCFYELPSWLFPSDEEDDEDAALDPDAPIRFQHALHYERNVEATLPTGFVTRELPESFDESYGPVRLQARFAFDPAERVVHGDLTLDIDEVEISPGDAERLSERLSEWTEDATEIIFIEHTGEILLVDGDVGGALAAFDLEAAEDPSDVMPLVRRSRALAGIGLPTCGRAHAERAVALDPGRTVAHRNLARLLAMDELGRGFGIGFDRAGALAAIRRAIETDEDDLTNQYLLAQLLEHNPNGVQFGEGWDPDGAYEAWNRLLAASDRHESDVGQRLVRALGRTGQWDRLESCAKRMEDQEQARLMRVVAAAGEGGVSAARRAARRGTNRDGANRTLAAALLELMLLREYETASAIAEDLFSGRPTTPEYARFLQALRDTRRLEDLSDDDISDVEQFMRSMLREIAVGSGTPQEFEARVLDPVLARSIAACGVDDEVSPTTSIAATLRAGSEGFGGFMDVGLDMMASAASVVVEEDGWHGFKVTYDVTAVDGVPLVAFYLVERDGDYFVLGTEDLFTISGFRSWEALEAGKGDVARRWIEWGTPESSRHADDPLSTLALTRIEQDRSLDEDFRTRSASLAAQALSNLASRVPALVDQELEAAEQDEQRSILLHVKLDAASTIEDHDMGLEVAERLLVQHPDSERLHEVRVNGWMRRGEYDRARAALAEHEWEGLGDLRYLAEIAEREGDLDESLRYRLETIESVDALRMDYNNLAWTQLLAGKADGETLERALMGAEDENPAGLNTLAMVHAEAGRLPEAYNAFLASTGASRLEELTDADRLVLGRMAEQAGEVAFARSQYEQILAGEPETGDPGSVAVYAGTRLRALDGDS